jgi:hypothetical protein
MANMDAYLRQVAETAYPDRLTAFLHLAGVEPYLAGMPVAFWDDDAFCFRVGEEDMPRPIVDHKGKIVCDYGDEWRESCSMAWHADVAEWLKLESVARFIEGRADELAIAALDSEDDDKVPLVAYCR